MPRKGTWCPQGVEIANAGLGGMPGESSYRFTHKCVENPDRNANALDRILVVEWEVPAQGRTVRSAA